MIVIKAPIKTVSEANMTGEHWSQKHKRHKNQRLLINYYFRSEIKDTTIPLPCKVILTRIAPRKLDIGDNLPISMKTCRDQIAEILTGEDKAGRGDGDSRLQFVYDQKKGKPKEYAIQIEIIPVTT